MIGSAFVPNSENTKPRSVMEAPPSEVTLPATLAVVSDTFVAAVAVTLGGGGLAVANSTGAP